MPGEEITLRDKRVPDAADVIIIMQHAACNKRIHMKLKDTIDDLEKALRAKGTSRGSHPFIQCCIHCCGLQMPHVSLSFQLFY